MFRGLFFPGVYLTIFVMRPRPTLLSNAPLQASTGEPGHLHRSDSDVRALEEDGHETYMRSVYWLLGDVGIDENPYFLFLNTPPHTTSRLVVSMLVSSFAIPTW